MAEPLELDLRDVLYRARGHDWDYAFLLQPAPILGEGWYGLHRRIFANVEPSSTPLLLRGALAIGMGHPFFATAFTDAVRRDYQGRPIAHYIAWLGAAAEAAPGLSFGPPLVEAWSQALSSVFELRAEALPRGDAPLDAVLRARFRAALPMTHVQLRCERVLNLRWLGSISA
jgi:hypothetical protein